MVGDCVSSVMVFIAMSYHRVVLVVISTDQSRVVLINAIVSNCATIYWRAVVRMFLNTPSAGISQNYTYETSTSYYT
jgi:hypothetical protein